MASEADRKTVTSFEEGWPLLQEAINKIIHNLEEAQTIEITSEEYMSLYTTAYNICQPNPIGPECRKLYNQYNKACQDYVSSKVLPSLREKKDEILLQELVRRWNDYKKLTRWISRFLHYVDRYFVSRWKLPTLQARSHLTFYELVYGEMNDKVRDSVILMIDQEREGEKIDQALLKNVLDIYVEMGDGSMKYYEKDFEEALFKDTTAFYSQKASMWITSESYDDYMLKVEGCSKEESERVSCYLQPTSQQNLLEVVEHELLSAHASKLEEKKQPRIIEAAKTE